MNAPPGPPKAFSTPSQASLVKQESRRDSLCKGPSAGFSLDKTWVKLIWTLRLERAKNNSLVTLVRSGDLLLPWPSHVSMRTLLSTKASTQQSRISDGRAFKAFPNASVSLDDMFRSLSWSFQKSRQDWLPPGRWRTQPHPKPEASVDKESRTCFSSFHGSQSYHESKNCQ